MEGQLGHHHVLHAADVEAQIEPDVRRSRHLLVRQGQLKGADHCVERRRHELRERRAGIEDHAAAAGRVLLEHGRRNVEHGAADAQSVEAHVVERADAGPVGQHRRVLQARRDHGHGGVAKKQRAGLRQRLLAAHEAVRELVAVEGAELRREGDGALAEPDEPVRGAEGALVAVPAAEGEVRDFARAPAGGGQRHGVGGEVAARRGRVAVGVRVLAVGAAGLEVQVQVAAHRVGAGERAVGARSRRVEERVRLLEALRARRALQPRQIAAGVHHRHEALRRRPHRQAHHVLGQRGQQRRLEVVQLHRARPPPRPRHRLRLLLRLRLRPRLRLRRGPAF
ncbi:hypothetical protein MARPO_0097s0043 [Marchantia polymorpha]|uniref:Uncharacterized protein n=1 Tax=Marchantia polymorpha TaxID=3197 RepID=A0A2R6WFG1_MARPO|nr:hypothetical protein MARPO_0097s0043 [Marchantia polymorpha]|eukprot:PTQ32561.1 hypothetical protein MARPO_0097s0043 [Marchantia polymorpha]